MELERIRRVSSAVFGNRYRLELMAELAAAGDSGVCLTDLAIEHAAKTSVFYPPLRALEQVGLVRRVGVVGPNRRVLYAATGHAAWHGLRRVIDDLGLSPITEAKPAGPSE